MLMTTEHYTTKIRRVGVLESDVEMKLAKSLGCEDKDIVIVKVSVERIDGSPTKYLIDR